MSITQEQYRLLRRVAHAYYIDSLTQQQIAKRFGLSRPKVSRMLKKAREKGIVTITLAPPVDGIDDLEQALERRYGLYEAVVVPGSNAESDATDSPVLVRELGAAAAGCLLRSMQRHETVGMTWGSTLLAVVDALSAHNMPDATVVQMLGGLGQPEAEVYGTDLARRVAQSLGSKLRLLPAPGIVASQVVRNALLAEPQIAGTLDLAAAADMALVGIGRLAPGSVVMQAGTILHAAEFEQLRALGAVGDIGLRFFDADGRPVEHEIDDRIIGLDLDQIKAIPRVIGVAGGPSKLDVIRAALRGRLIDVLVTDEENAKRLCAGEEA